jgi:restriction endonuclease S subunit
LCKTTSGGTPSKGHDEYYNGGTIPWLRSGEVNKLYIYDTELFITEEGLRKSSAKWFPEDTVVIAMYGATVGQVGILKNKMTTNQAICGILPNEYFTPVFLYHFLLSKKKDYLKLAAGGAQPNISQNIIKDTLILLPPLTLQQAFASKIEAIEKQKELIKQSIKEVETLFNSRMDYYFN